MSAITFGVLDTACSEADQSFFPPSITMTARSVTKISTILGWAEFPGFASTPPKRYKTINWTGTSEQQLWYLGVQIGGAKYEWVGADTIDSQGNVLTRHSKFVSVMCNSANGRANIVGGTYPQNTNYSLAASFLGYFGTNSTFYPNLYGPTELCAAGSVPYEDTGNQAATSPFDYPLTDLVGLWGSGGGLLGVLQSAVVVTSSSTLAASTDTGTTNVSMNPYAVPLVNGFLILENFSSLQTPSGVVPRPPDWNVGGQVIFTNNFSATLADEYTDAEALTVARTINGNGTVAQNLPRTTGYVSSSTSVTFTLTCGNLISGQSYTVEVELADLTNATSVTKTYNISAGGTVEVITDTVPTPTAGHSVVVRNQRIAFG